MDVSFKKFQLHWAVQFKFEAATSAIPITEEFKVTKVRQHLMLRESRDGKAREEKVLITEGRKWSIEETVAEAESRLRQSDILEL